MKIYSEIELMRAYAKRTKQYCMHISWSKEVSLSELIKAAPYLEEDDVTYSGHTATLAFSTKKEMYEYFNMTVGDDGPTELNNYTGPASVYALTCSAAGELETENT